MAKSFQDVVQDSSRTGLGIPVETKKPLSRTNTPPVEPPFGFKLRGRLVPVRCDFYWPYPMFRSRRPSSSLVFITSVMNDSMSVQIHSDWSIRETIVSGVSSAPAAWPTAALAMPHFCADEECVLRIIHMGIAVVTHLLVSLLEAPQVRVKTESARERLRQIQADFPVLFFQPGGELRDQVVGPFPGLLTMPSCQPFFDKSMHSILV